MKAIPFDVFGSIQAISCCANVADPASWPVAFYCPRQPGMQSSRRLVMLAFSTKKSATSLRMFFLNALSAFSPMMFDLPYRRTE
jgi:hypothetical protein